MAAEPPNPFRAEREHYGEHYNADYLTLFRDYVASADRISDRRQLANSFFLTANTALLALTGYFSDTGEGLIWLAAFAGILFSFAWRRLIDSYRALNGAKFDVIQQLEQRLPFAAYEAEWTHLERRQEGLPSFSKLEAAVPMVFIALHGTVFLFSALRWAQTHLLQG